ncbi:MAG: hypothetical protein ACRD06_08505 [Terriglobia bacterium]
MTDKRRVLAECLRKAISEAKPHLVAEEYSEESLKKWGQVSTIARDVAVEAQIEHRFCDPDTGQREEIGYKERPTLWCEIVSNSSEGLSADEIDVKSYAVQIACYFPVREEFWLKQLGDISRKDVIFVCGENHVESFRELLERAGIPSEILQRGIGVMDGDDGGYGEAKEYLKNHPEIARRC